MAGFVQWEQSCSSKRKQKAYLVCCSSAVPKFLVEAGGHECETAAAQGRLRTVSTFQRQRADRKLAGGKRGLGIWGGTVGCNQKGM